MRLRELRGKIKQSELVAIVKKVDNRVDSGLVSKYENGIALPTPKQLDAICNFLGVEPLDIYSPQEIYLDKHKPEIAKIRSNKQIEETTYTLTARLDRETCKWLKKEILTVCGYASITDFVKCSVAKLGQQYELRQAQEKTTQTLERSSGGGNRIIVNNTITLIVQQ